MNWSRNEYCRTAESRKRDRKRVEVEEIARRDLRGRSRRILVRSSDGREERRRRGAMLEEVVE